MCVGSASLSHENKLAEDTAQTGGEAAAFWSLLCNSKVKGCDTSMLETDWRLTAFI